MKGWFFMLVKRNGILFEVSEFCPSFYDLNKSDKAYSVYSETSPCCIVKFVNSDNDKEVYYDFFYEDFYQVSRKLHDYAFPVSLYSLDKLISILEVSYYESFLEDLV